MKWMAFLPAFVLLTGCGNIQGIPVGIPQLSRKDYGYNLSGQILKARELRDIYVNARNDNKSFDFWTSASLIPASVGAASAVAFGASKDAIAAIGLFAGGVVGTRSFVNSATNSKVYQRGIDALNCLEAYVSPYENGTILSNLSTETSGTRVELLRAEKWLVSMQGYLSDRKRLSEGLKENPSDVEALLNLQKRLEVAVNAAKLSLSISEEKETISHNIDSFVALSITLIDSAVASKVSFGEVDYKSGVQSVLSMMEVQRAGSPSAASGGLKPDGEKNDIQNISNIIGEGEDISNKISVRTANLSGLNGKIKIKEHLEAVSACVQAI